MAGPRSAWGRLAGLPPAAWPPGLIGPVDETIPFHLRGRAGLRHQPGRQCRAGCPKLAAARAAEPAVIQSLKDMVAIEIDAIVPRLYLSTRLLMDLARE